MLPLNQDHMYHKLDFIANYPGADNAADGATLDANAKVTSKNIATLEAELMKDFFIQINHASVKQKI